MHRRAAFRQHRAKEREKLATEATLPISCVVKEPTIRRSVTPIPESQVNDLPENQEPVTIESLQGHLTSANGEIARLKAVIARSTHDGVSINIPVPPINATGLTADTYEAVKVFYCGIISEMIKTTYTELESKNRQAYGFYRVDGEKKEINITIATTNPE